MFFGFNSDILKDLCLESECFEKRKEQKREGKGKEK
jgi:hypothetical protein